LIIQRYLLREIVATFAGVALLLSLIFLSGTFVRILSEAVAGTYPATVVLKLFALKGVGNLVFILPLAFFLSILLALGRLYRDSEMTVLYACGIGPERIYRSVGTLALAVAALLAFLALYFAPWAEERSYRLLDEAGARSEIEGLAAGRFNQTGADGVQVYVESMSADRSELGKVFAQGLVEGRQQLLTAARARQQTEPDGERFLVFLDGYRYEGLPGAPDFRIIEFREHGIRLVDREVVARERPRHAVPSLDLWRGGSPGELSELQWRIAVPITTILLGLLAVPLSRSSPREGRYGRLFVGILVYIVYNNLLTVAKSSLAKGEVSPLLGLWWVHAIIIALLAFIVWRQQRLPGPRRSAA
jgi:lipopolysaccharide export system permease protein